MMELPERVDTMGAGISQHMAVLVWRTTTH
jgi:hypothetical protein